LRDCGIAAKVTARSEEVNFRAPVRTGQLVELLASVVKVCRSSMKAEVEMTTEDPLSGDRRICTTGRSAMIALDSDGAPPPFRHCRNRPCERAPAMKQSARQFSYRY
jgi:acyl-CoA hydrolase